MVEAFEYDEIGYWSEIKLDIVKKYASAYTKILSSQPSIKKLIYIDAFAGAGHHISKRTRGFVQGSPLNALTVEPHFHEFHFIDLHGGKADQLRKIVSTYKNTSIYEGDANTILLDQVFPRCQYLHFHRALCLLDPYGLAVDWEILETAGHMGSVEIFYNFMIMDANMNVLWRNPDKVDSLQAQRLDKVWGDHSWKQAAYMEQPTLWGTLVDKKAPNRDIAEAFRKRLEQVAGFKYVPDPIPMRNGNGAIIYYLFFGSPNRIGAKIVEDIFSNYKDKGMV